MEQFYFLNKKTQSNVMKRNETKNEKKKKNANDEEIFTLDRVLLHCGQLDVSILTI